MFFIFNNVWDYDPIFQGVETTNQKNHQGGAQDGLAAVLHQAGPPSGGEVGKVMGMMMVVLELGFDHDDDGDDHGDDGGDAGDDGDETHLAWSNLHQVA